MDYEEWRYFAELDDMDEEEDENVEYPEPNSIDDPTWFGINKYTGDNF